MPGEREPVSRDADILAIEEALDDLDYLCFGLGEEDGSLVKARAALSRVEERLAERTAVEGREGMATVWDHGGRYLGCIGIETWAELLAREEERRIEETRCACGHPQGWHRYGEGSCLECGCLGWKAARGERPVGEQPGSTSE